MCNAAFLAFDTSCYTTSIAVVSGGNVICDKREMLKVPQGQRGLRQSEAVFEHIKNIKRLFADAEIHKYDIKAVSYSEKPCPLPESYMPVFCVGETFGVSCASAFGVKTLALTHQHGHIYSAFLNNMIDDGAYICFHVSGGTLDILRVDIKDRVVKSIDTIGGGLDITCGQLIDRVGVAAGLSFPSGQEIERMYVPGADKLAVNVQGLGANLSGAETQAMRRLEDGQDAASVCSSVIDCVAQTLEKMIVNAAKVTEIEKFIFTGGVICNTIIRDRIGKLCADKSYRWCFAEKEYSSDNACGLALAADIFFRQGEDN